MENLEDFYKHCGDYSPMFGFEFLFNDDNQRLVDMGKTELQVLRTLPVEPTNPDEFFNLLLPSQKRRLEKYMDMENAIRASGKSFSDDYVAVDLDHEPSKRARISRSSKLTHSTMCCCIGHGCIWSVTDRKWMTTAGWARLHCYPMNDVEHGISPVPVRLDKLMEQGLVNASEVKNMIGNGWHLRSLGQFLMWILASVTPRQNALPASLALKEDEVKDDSTVGGSPLKSSSEDSPCKALQSMMNEQISELLVIDVVDSQDD